jgi:hypothetical protein
MTNKERERIAIAIRTLGATETARRLGLSTEATLRLAGDFGTQAGTEALAAQRLDRLGEAGDVG